MFFLSHSFISKIDIEMMQSNSTWNNLYLTNLLNNYHPRNDRGLTYNTFQPLIQQWANQDFLGMTVSGSLAKDTAIRGKSDLDFLISLRKDDKDNSRTLKNVYWELYDLVDQSGLVQNLRDQRVSIGFQFYGFDIDFVPAIKDKGNTNFHKLYVNQPNKRWIKTNIRRNINYVLSSKRCSEIRLLKIWRKCLQIDFPSVYLEMATINCLKHSRYDELSNNLEKALQYFANISFLSDKYYDLSNSNNIISDSLSISEKQKVLKAAQNTLSRFQSSDSWESILY